MPPGIRGCVGADGEAVSVHGMPLSGYSACGCLPDKGLIGAARPTFGIPRPPFVQYRQEHRNGRTAIGTASRRRNHFETGLTHPPSATDQMGDGKNPDFPRLHKVATVETGIKE